MISITPAVQKFFTEFTRASNALDLPVILSEFTESFLYANAKGTQVIKKEHFAAAVTKQKEMFNTFGLQSSETVPVEEVALDDFYTLVKAQVTMLFHKDRKPVEVRQQATYILSMKDKPVICFYANPNDLMQLMSAAGLVASKPAADV